MNIYLGSDVQYEELEDFLRHIDNNKQLSLVKNNEGKIDRNIDFVFMPNSQEEILAQSFSIPYYKKQTQSFKNKLKSKCKKIIFFLCHIALKCFNPKTNDREKQMILIKTDAIGDYLLFRNFLDPLVKQYGKITIVANQSCKEIIEEFDLKYFSQVFFVNRKLFVRNPLYAFLFLKKIRQTHYNILINPIYSRDLISEEISRNVCASKKIASMGDTSNLTLKEKKQYDQNYTSFVPATQKILFEFYRNLEFFQFILDKNLKVDYFIELQETQSIITKFNLHSPYSVFFIGASEDFRKWSEDHLIEVGKFISSEFSYDIVLCGGKEDFARGEYIKKALDFLSIKCINLCGKTSIPDLAKVVYNGNHLLSNETSCAHIAHAIRHSKIFVVSNGNHLYRFTPYPQEIGGKSIEIYHPTIQKNLDAYAIISNFLQQQNQLNINEITPKDVTKIIAINSAFNEQSDL